MIPKKSAPPSTIAASVIVGPLVVTALVFGNAATALPVFVIAAIAILVWYSTRFWDRTLPRAGAFVAYFIPLIAYPVLYEPIHTMMVSVNPAIVDPQLLAIDRFIFGVDPIRRLYDIGSPALTDFSYLAYFSYYFGMPVLLIVMFFKGPRRDFEKVLLVMTLGWYVALISYQFFPALGPHRYLGTELPSLQGGWPTTEWIQSFLAASLVPTVRDCVPSMHTAITILTLVYAYRYHRTFFFIYLIPGLGLIFATMYTQQHYVTDVILGVFAAAFLYWAVESTYARSSLFKQNATTTDE